MTVRNANSDVPERLDSDDGSSARDSAPRAFRLDSVRIRNFKKIVDTKIDLGSITYLVGGNNSGKSSVLQALHTAVSCAQASVELGQQVVAEASLRYSPVADFSLLGHGAPYENRSVGQRGIVEFEGTARDSDDEAKYKIEMYKARNHNNVGVDRSGLTPGFGQVICDPKKLFSVYVPGLAGVPHREEMSGYAAVFRKAASGEANLVFRNIIRLLDERGRLGELESLVGEILRAPVSFKVNFDPDRDLYVDIRLAGAESTEIGGFLPVDLWGTGILQVTQIFAYVLLFEPALLLVDEPDSHLHPSRQKSLGAALEKTAERFNCKVIVSTHSRHLITGASEAVKVVWMKDGRVEASDERELTALLMDLGALDQLDNSTKVIIYTEDENPKILEKALASSSLAGDEVKIATFNGLNNSFAAIAFQEMAEMMASSPRVFIHRDRDFLTNEEIEAWSRQYVERGIHILCPKLCDTEAYCTTAEHISKVTGISREKAQTLRKEVIEKNLGDLRSKHRKKRSEANRHKINQDGGAPLTADLWPEDVFPTDDLIYGKFFLKVIEKELRSKGLLEKGDCLSDHVCNALTRELDEAFEMAESSA